LRLIKTLSFSILLAVIAISLQVSAFSSVAMAAQEDGKEKKKKKTKLSYRCFYTL